MPPPRAVAALEYQQASYNGWVPPYVLDIVPQLAALSALGGPTMRPPPGLMRRFLHVSRQLLRHRRADGLATVAAGLHNGLGQVCPGPARCSSSQLTTCHRIAGLSLRNLGSGRLGVG